MKRIVLTIAILAGFVMPSLAHDFVSGNLLYTIISTDPPCVSLDGHVDGQAAQGELSIPETVEYGDVVYTVASIGRRAFYNCQNLTGDLVIPNTVTHISIEAFSHCTGFTGSLVIPDAINELATDNLPGGATFEGAFEGCSGFSHLVLGGSLKTIGCSCFAGCTGFEGELNLPEGLEEIWTCAFSGCTGFTDGLALPASLKKIESSAFYGCEGFMGNLTLPESLETVGDDAFAWCTGFSDIDLHHQVFYTHSFGKAVFTGWNLTEIDIPEGWTTTGDWTFSRCGRLERISLPESLTDIGAYAFAECDNLSAIGLPSNLESIGTGSFDGCRSLAELRLPQSLTSIGGWAFRRSGIAGEVRIPDLVGRIEAQTFDSCFAMTRIVLGKSVNYVSDRAFRDTRLESMVIKAAIPPELAFQTHPVFLSESLPILVPCGCLEVYQNTACWEMFTSMNEGIVDLFKCSSADEIAGTVGIKKEADCDDRLVEVVALPNGDREFLYWEANGETVSTENPYSFMLEEDTELVAYFSGYGLDDGLAQQLSIHPNPASDFVRIEGTDPSEVRVRNAFGQTVKTVRNTKEISMADLPAGVYFVSITDSEGRTCVKKVVKE